MDDGYARIKQRLQLLYREPGAVKPLPKPIPRGDGQLPEWKRVGDFTLLRRYRLEEIRLPGWPSGEAEILPCAFTHGDVLFFDTETTGLSGGAGSVVFLVGFGWYSDTGLNVEQVFLTDFPGEYEFLETVSERLKQRPVVVSYNGKSFDRHLLRSRFLMNGIMLDLVNLDDEHHLDLLHITRRFWRRVIGSCSLTQVERKVLGLRRTHDLPSEEVPDRYFEYLRNGDAHVMADVFSHNLYDVGTLARIYDAIGGLVSGTSSVTRVDLTALGEFLLRSGNHRGIVCLRESFRQGDVQAGVLLSLHGKRRGEWSASIQIWQRMAERKNVFSAIELAKYFEHKRKDPTQALSWVERVLSWRLPLAPNVRTALAKRKQRLLAKIERQK